MPDKLAPLATRYVRTHEAARILGLSPRTLEKYRCHGSGPTFRKLGGRVVYAIDDLEAWADQAACRSTSDPRYVAARAAGHPNRRAS
jgi:predicted DNA-binding transcriptional regulator AlpA